MLFSTFMEVTTSGKAAVNQEIFESLTDIEKKLAESHVLIKIKGKRGKHVPCLLPSDAKGAMDVLALKRHKLGIHKENPYFFATPTKTNELLPSRLELPKQIY